jgi:putative heme-binding domain-containing protein
MYRQVIEHPEWIPKDWQKKLDLRAGADKGRIYRVVPVGVKPRAIPRLDKLDTAGLVAALDSPNGWQRDMAQMMLLWRNDNAAVPLLEKMATENKNPLARLHALCTLDGLDANNKSVLAKAYKDKHPGVRRHAVRISEKPIGGSRPPLIEFKVVREPDPHVRLQQIYSRGELKDVGAVGPSLEEEDLKDPFMLAALMSSVTEKDLDQMLPGLGRRAIEGKSPLNYMRDVLSFAMAMKKTSAMRNLLLDISVIREPQFPRSFEVLAVILDVLEEHNELLARWTAKHDADLELTFRGLQKYFNTARRTVADGKAPLDSRVQAARILGRGPDQQSEDIKLLSGLLTPETPPELQSAAMTELARLRDDDVLKLLLKGWKGYTPALRSQMLDALFSRDKGTKSILDAIENKEISPIDIDPARRQRLLQQKNAELRERAARLFASVVNPDREKVVESYHSVLTMKGDAANGAKLFAKHCATCHRFQGVGEEVGPDLASLGDKSPEALLVAILDPNRAVEARYLSYIAATKSGVTYTGLLASETGNSVTLVSQDGKKHTILRTDLEALSSTDKSLMPEGLEKELKPQDVADVIAHLRVGVPAPERKTFEGNKPEVVKADKDGSLVLSARTCEIYGASLFFEPLRLNLGYWRSEDDRAVWTVEVPRAGKYTVSLNYACPDNIAGNRFQLEAGGRRLTGIVAGTGGWHAYKQAKAGEIELAAGRQTITLRSAGKINEYLMDLRSVRLVPAGAK